MNLFRNSLKVAVTIFAASQLFSSCTSIRFQANNNSLGNTTELSFAQNTKTHAHQNIVKAEVQQPIVKSVSNQMPTESKAILLAGETDTELAVIENRYSNKALGIPAKEMREAKNNIKRDIKDIKKAKGAKTNDGNHMMNNQLLASILAIPVLPGMLGLHRFYLGYYWQGALQLLLTVLMVTAFISFVWAIVDFLRIIFGNLKPRNDSYRTTFRDL